MEFTEEEKQRIFGSKKSENKSEQDSEEIVQIDTTQAHTPLALSHEVLAEADFLEDDEEDVFSHLEL
jgi:hypothetical protein